ncbi:two-component sensor histidine kinase [Microbispora rosea subsp. aerata]|nr:ATP-binding protein [Microbispora rosea]GGO20967.1 two-component sensor histidine kinase [Microbispora rosea subsp. aerata]GIH56113.1 two-component sensor histidine kinase [Microbispora rosea subsp. aerata]GLJ85678.1 two-component sensor histidine kinase [Microbispora rosea subsp. aerata]
MSGRTPLRIRLSAAMLALVAVALAVIGVGSVSVLRDYLVSRVDMQVGMLAREAGIRLDRGPLAFARLRVPPEGRVEIRDPGGRTLLAQAGMGVEDRPGPGAVTSVVPVTVPAVSGDGLWRARVVPVQGFGTVVVAVDMASVKQITARLALIEALVGGALMVVLAVVGVVIVRRSLRPLAEIEATAEAIARGNLSSRIPDRDPRTEVGRLARALNGMLTQIELAFRARAASEAAARESEAKARESEAKARESEAKARESEAKARESEAKARESEAKARESEARMRRFVADASHELRTPLTSIRGFAEFHRQVPDADITRLMSRIESEAARMGLLVDDLLLLARLDQQRPLRMQPVDLLALAADAVHDARALCPDRGVSLVVEGEAALIVAGDEVRLRQVVGNLMSNARTHTPEGTPITVRVGSQDGTAFVEVADKGPGLTPEQAARVFERFYRADPSRTRGGSGLGLAIVESLVRAHGGEVSVETAPGAGAAFRVTLPLAPEART